MKMYTLSEIVDELIVIAIDNIKKELKEQPIIYNNVCGQTIEYKIALEKINLKIIELTAKLSLQFKELKPKPSDAVIKNMVIDDENIKKLNQKHLEIKENYEQWNAIKLVWEQRKSCLIELSKHIVSKDDKITKFKKFSKETI